MALSASTLAGLVYADYLAVIPTATDANRENTTTGVPLHNVPFELLTAISAGFVDALSSITLSDSYKGVEGESGTTAGASYAVPTFNPGVITAASSTFLTTLGWTGEQAATFTDIFITSFFNKVASVVLISMNDIPNGGDGVGTISSGVNPDLGATATGLFQSSILSEIASSGYFCTDDTPGNSPTPEISNLVSSLATAYGTIVGEVSAVITYNGTDKTSGSSLEFNNTGNFI